jgi:hypothetical protein
VGNKYKTTILIFPLWGLRGFNNNPHIPPSGVRGLNNASPRRILPLGARGLKMKTIFKSPFGGMGANYFKIAWRSIQKSKMMFSINVIGLALGIATCLVISLFVIDELSYDRFNENANHIVRVNLSAKMGDELIDESSVMAPVAQTFKNEFPEVKATTRLLKTADIAKVVYNNQTFRIGKSAMVDSTFFDVFSINFVKGNAKNALNSPQTLDGGF